jgi:hypothetical protein
MAIYYTIHEGGEWHKLERPIRRNKAVRDLKRYRRRNPETGISYSKITFHIVHSVIFGKNRIWDSHFNGFRK